MLGGVTAVVLGHHVVLGIKHGAPICKYVLSQLTLLLGTYFCSFKMEGLLTFHARQCKPQYHSSPELSPPDEKSVHIKQHLPFPGSHASTTYLTGFVLAFLTTSFDSFCTRIAYGIVEFQVCCGPEHPVCGCIHWGHTN